MSKKCHVVSWVIIIALLATFSGASQPDARHFVKYTAQGMGWDAARQVCRQSGAYLATVDQFSNAYLLQAFILQYNNDNVWIGLHDVAQQYNSVGTQGFRWSTCNTLGNWVNWADNQPADRYNNWCVRLQYQMQFQWNNEQCSSLSQFLCHKHLGPCTSFRNSSAGCDVISANLRSINVSVAQSDVECRSYCLAYEGSVSSSSDVCWMFSLLSLDQGSIQCVVYVGTVPIYCGSGAGGPANNEWVRDCYSLQYNTSTNLGVTNTWQEKHQINCSSVTTPVLPETTTVEQTTVETTALLTFSTSTTTTAESTTSSPSTVTTTAISESTTEEPSADSTMLTQASSDLTTSTTTEAIVTSSSSDVTTSTSKSANATSSSLTVTTAASSANGITQSHMTSGSSGTVFLVTTETSPDEASTTTMHETTTVEQTTVETTALLTFSTSTTTTAESTTSSPSTVTTTAISESTTEEPSADSTMLTQASSDLTTSTTTEAIVTSSSSDVTTSTSKSANATSSSLTVTTAASSANGITQSHMTSGSSGTVFLVTTETSPDEASTTTMHGKTPTADDQTTTQDNNNNCQCACHKNVVMNVTRIEEVTQELQKNLILDKSNLSKTRRRKTSATDDRPSAKATGGVGIVFFVGVLLLLVIPDLKAVYDAIFYRVA